MTPRATLFAGYIIAALALMVYVYASIIKPIAIIMGAM